ncbi:MFS transporter [Paenibacillus thalictri]|uniref:MFS transporter n=1 Tax=Paenibacillus thalictri TaxID=2527873 RepID=A0A4V2J424_9BACL|nr:MFS transporter [Paenibacillus thalictri]TBL77363.1 MFS transporter [Paenibacillus thalictri]
MEAASGLKTRSFAVIKSFNFFVYGAIAIYSSFFPLYLKEIGVPSLQIGMLLAGGPFIAILANPFWGYWSDRWRNIKLILIVLLIGNAVVMQSVFLGVTGTLLFVLMLVYFFFQSPLFSQSNSLILDTIEHTGRRFGEFRVWGSLGWALMAAAAGPVLGFLGINRFWIIYSLLMLIAIAIAFVLPRGKPRPKTDVQRGGYVRIFANRQFVAFLAISVLISVPNGMNMTFMPIYISDLGGKEGLVGLSAFLTSIFEIPVFLLFDRLLPKNNRTMILCLAVVSLLYAARWLLMSLATSPYEVVGIQVLNGITFGGYYYIGTQLTFKLVPLEYRASGQALYALSWGGLSGIIAGIAGGWVFQNWGAVAMYQFGSILALMGLAGFLGVYALMKRSPSTNMNLDEKQ